MFTDSTLFAFLCHGCGATLVGRPCMDVDSAREPMVRELLMDGVLNRYHCETCHHRGVSPMPVIYRNSRLGFCVVFVPPHLVESREFAELFLALDRPRKDLSGVDAKVMEGQALVFSMDELARQMRFREIVSKHHAEPWKAPVAAPAAAVAKPGPAWTAEPPPKVKVPGPKVQYRKTKELLLRRIAERFIHEHVYTDTDVTTEIVAALRKENQSLVNSPMYAPDHLRLGLIELQLMARTPDCSRYWKC